MYFQNFPGNSSPFNVLSPCFGFPFSEKCIHFGLIFTCPISQSLKVIFSSIQIHYFSRIICWELFFSHWITSSPLSKIIKYIFKSISESFSHSNHLYVNQYVNITLLYIFFCILNLQIDHIHSISFSTSKEPRSTTLT